MHQIDQHSVLTTDGAGGESPAPFSFTVCLELDFATAGLVWGIHAHPEGRNTQGAPTPCDGAGLKCSHATIE
jgi:hypothetical protein